jgi:chromosome segregation ATPase
MKKITLSLTLASTLMAAVGFMSCDGESKSSLKMQVDSLTTKLEEQAEDLSYYQDCLDIVSDGLDSIAAADSSLMMVTGNKEGTISKESIRENLAAYADMLARQHERIQNLENELSGNKRELSKMKQLLAYLNKQIAEKDATIKSLNEQLDQKNFDINKLKEEVGRLNVTNADLTNTVKQQDEAITVAQEMLNEAYYIVGTNKELKKQGVLSKKFLGKAQMNSDVDVSAFKKIDIRQVTQIQVDSKNAKILSSHPSNSYSIRVDKANKSSVITILDEVAFWSLTRYLVIEK